MQLQYVLTLLWIIFAQNVFSRPTISKVAPENIEFFGRVTSYQKPVKVPEPISMYQQFAGLAQQSNCFKTKINATIGDAQLLFSWGDDDKNQRMQIFRSKSLGIVTSWSGMNVTSLTSLLSAADLFLVDVDRKYFPRVKKGSKLYDGFQNAFKRAAPVLMKKIQYFQELYDEDRVSLTGLSFGAALADIALPYVKENLKRGHIHRVVVFGHPRIGNQEWADSLDTYAEGKFFYVVNGNDIVPHLPPREFGYQQPSGQIWINPSNSSNWKLYPGQENVHGANSMFGFSIKDHTGVYFRTEIGSFWGHCPATIGQD